MTEELKIEQTDSLNAQAAEAEDVYGAKKEEVSYGKFKNADALYSAYNSLQAEFTRRCQRLKELEDRNKKTADGESSGEERLAETEKNFFAAQSLNLGKEGKAVEREKGGTNEKGEKDSRTGENASTGDREKTDKTERTDGKAEDGNAVKTDKTVPDKPRLQENPLLADSTDEQNKEEKAKREKLPEERIAFDAAADDGKNAADGEKTPVRVISEQEKKDVLKEYLEGVLMKKTGAILMEGAGASLKTPRSRPKTVEEAGRLFRDSFGKIQ